MGNSLFSTSPIEFLLSPEEMSKLGELSLVWSHTEHVIARCLIAILQFNDDEALSLIYPMTLDQKLRNIDALSNHMTGNSRLLFEELKIVAKAIKVIRNDIAHGVLVHDLTEGLLFRNTSKDRVVSKTDIFDSQEISNYTLWIAIALRGSIESPSDVERTLPERPDIPAALREYVPSHKK